MTVSAPIKRLEVTDIASETKEAKTFFLSPLDDWQPAYEPGQFLTLIFGEGPAQQRRSYSMSSSFILGEPLAVTVKRIPNGRISRHLIDHCNKGDLWQTSGFSGFFTLPKNIEQYECYFFLAAGSGITPCYSLIKTLLAVTQKNIVLVYSNSNKPSAIFYEQLKLLAEQYPERFKCKFLFSDSKYYQDARLSKPLLQQLLKEYVDDDLQATVFYTCGPELYMQIITITLLAEGIHRDNIRRESFDSRPRLFKPRPPDLDPHSIKIRFHNQDYNITAAWPQTILAAAKENHIQLPYSCEAGRCGSCAATCISGKVWMGYNEVLVDEELARGKILTCQAYAVGGDVEILA